MSAATVAITPMLPPNVLSVDPIRVMNVPAIPMMVVIFVLLRFFVTSNAASLTSMYLLPFMSMYDCWCCCGFG